MRIRRRYPGYPQHSFSPAKDRLAMDPQPTLAEFVWFSKLPFELRADIWERALPQESRVVKVCQDSDRMSFEVQGRNRVAIPTSLLHASQESRSVSLKVYEVFQGGWHGSPIYFDFKNDTLCTSDESRLGSAHPEHKSFFQVDSVDQWQTKIRHLRVNNWDPLLSDYGILKSMRSLQSIEFQLAFMVALFRFTSHRSAGRTWEHAEAVILEDIASRVAPIWLGRKDDLPAIRYLPGVCIIQH